MTEIGFTDARWDKARQSGKTEVFPLFYFS